MINNLNIFEKIYIFAYTQVDFVKTKLIRLAEIFWRSVDAKIKSTWALKIKEQHLLFINNKDTMNDQFKNFEQDYYSIFECI